MDCKPRPAAGPGPGSTTASNWKADMVQALQFRASGIHTTDATAKVQAQMQALGSPTASSCSSTSNVKAIGQGSVNSISSLSMADFEMGRIIGAGSFGRVAVAKRRSDGVTYVIKCISKAACIKDGQVRHVIDEKHMLARVSGAGHPFLVNLRGAFQDAAALYLVLDFVPGGEFFCFLRDYPVKHGCKMKEDHARFYAAQIILALEYLQSLKIAYRDLKPENLLMGHDGYIKLTDFGFAKEVRDMTYTMCCTPDYAAPEVIKSQGHTPAVDWWSLGCVIYEMLYGFPPFYGEGNPSRTYENVLARKLVFPRHWSDLVKNLIEGLLQVDPRQRLGAGPDNLAKLKSHAWFQGLDWKLILNKRYQPPHRPRVASPDDTSNFDDYSRLPPVVHPFPLSTAQQKLFEAF